MAFLWCSSEIGAPHLVESIRKSLTKSRGERLIQIVACQSVQSFQQADVRLDTHRRLMATLNSVVQPSPINKVSSTQTPILPTTIPSVLAVAASTQNTTCRDLSMLSSITGLLGCSSGMLVFSPLNVSDRLMKIEKQPFPKLTSSIAPPLPTSSTFVVVFRPRPRDRP